MPHKLLSLTAVFVALIAAPLTAGATEPASDADSLESSVKEFFTVTDEIGAAEDAASDGIEWIKGTFDGADRQMDDVDPGVPLPSDKD